MDSRAVAVLEFPKIREQLAERTAFAASRELALVLEPAAGRRAVEQGLQGTTEAKLLMELQPEFSVRAAHDVRQAAENARIGGTLEPQILLDVRDTLEAGAYVKSTLARFADRVPLLAGRAATIDPCAPVLQAIRESIGDRGQVLDTASPELGSIRSRLRTAYNRLMDSLQRIMEAAAARGLLQEAIITTRGGRYVVPVRAEARNQFRGIVHDESASGATVFMEPLASLELNNEWRHLQLEEENEVERVLHQLSARVGQVADQLAANVNSLAAVDLALAKAKYAYSLRAAAPALTDDLSLNLIEARHPLLTGDVVPVSVWLGKTPRGGIQEGPAAKDFIALVITGPNTGGKTVTLKTVGLLQLMAQAGLHIPADPGSAVAVFDDVFADIGDEQSIEQSLSTFSSHMGNIVRILGQADEHCLVLLDELGAGTDPQEGSALARAILSYLVERGFRSVATTHYSELKAFAYEQPGVQNASVEFDVETLRPTFRLIIGLPGRSNALAIAQRLGLPEHILAAARGHLAPTSMQIEDLLAAIQAERDAARTERRAAERVRAEAEVRRGEVEQRLDAMDDERVAVLEQARREAEQLLENARQEIRRAEHQVAAAGGDRMAVLRAARGVQQAAQEMAGAPALPRRRPAPEPAEAERPLAVGDRVEVRRLNAVGQIVSEANERGEVEVQLGGLRTRVGLRDLTRVTRREADARSGGPERPAPRASQVARPAIQVPAPRSVNMEIDVRGTRADDVLPRVEQYLSDAYLSGMPFVRVIHGKGTGVLRQIIRDYLAQSPMVASYQSASQADGGEGATMVKLAV